MTTTATKMENKISGELLEPYLKALLGASGITDEQAKICLLYAICTYRDDLEKTPVFAVTGKTGTGKSNLLEQMALLVNEPKRATGTTDATVRNEMGDCRTYIIDEADKISERLLLCRAEKTLSKISVNEGTGHGWKLKSIDIFGATILARRSPFADSAVRNRAIAIKTKNNHGDYEVRETQRLEEINKGINIERLSLGEGRVQDTWTPLLEVAKTIDDPSYEEAVNNAMEAERSIFRSGQQYEAEEVVLYALDRLTWSSDKKERLDIDVLLSDLTSTASEIGDLTLTKKQVEELLISIGFKVTFTHGAKFVRSDVERLEKLLEGY